MSFLKALCRLCLVKLSALNKISVFVNETDENVFRLIYICTSVELKRDEFLPENICKDCFVLLSKYLNFREQCQNTENLLLRMLQCRDKDNIMGMTSMLDESYNNYELISKLVDENNHKPETVTTKTSNVSSSTKCRKSSKCSRNIIKDVKTESQTLSDQNPNVMEGSHDQNQNPKLLLDSINTDSKVILADLCSIIGEQHKRNKTKRRRLKGEPKPTTFTCKDCKKSYPSEGGWRYHVNTVHNKLYQPYICDICGKPFKVKKNVEAHKNAVHFNIKQNLCDLCGRGFATKYALSVHKIWHSGEKNFPCEICGLRFNTLSKVNTHRTTHDGPKNFMCEVCSRKYRWKKDFEIHVRTHTGEKPFICRYCNRAFSSVTNMKKHEKNHMKQLIDTEAKPTDSVYNTQFHETDRVVIGFDQLSENTSGENWIPLL